MKHQDAAGLALAEAARAHGDPDTVALLVAAQTEAARLEAMDADPRTLTNRRALLKVAAYREADYQLCQLRDALRHRLREGDLIATARERPAGPRIDVPAAAWRHLSPAFEDSSARDGMGQIALYDVRVTTAAPALTSLPREAARAWMEKHVTGPGSWKRDLALDACVEATGCLYREALAAWTALPEAKKRTRGRPKKSGK
jgi:hypothetical protein